MDKQELRKQIGDQIRQHDLDQIKEPMTGNLEDYILSIPLIAAAPRMLEALKQVMHLSVSAEGDEIFIGVKAAIDKAEGK